VVFEKLLGICGITSLNQNGWGVGIGNVNKFRNVGREWLFIVRRNDRGKVYEEEEGRFKEGRPSAGEEGEVGSQQFAGKRKPPIS
jgi:hypothetical protein